MDLYDNKKRNSQKASYAMITGDPLLSPDNNLELLACTNENNKRLDENEYNIFDHIRALVGKNEVICGLSGGVDSSVLATLLHRAIGDKSKAIFINHGLLRKNETEEVLVSLQKDLGINIKLLDESKIFLNILTKITDPEKKRKIIGEQFIRSFESAI